MARQSYSEEVLDGRLVVRAGIWGQHRQKRIVIASLNKHRSMNLTPLELAALLDGPLERALKAANE